jgi:8-oxo-dGTP pyrophosphatase MutT (NUDIX family)
MAASRRPRTAREFSAGGVVVRQGAGGPECIVIVPTRRAAGGAKVLTLPKGHPDEGETPEQAALREVREETGVEASVVGFLDDVRYFYQRDGRRISKVVSFFLLEHVAGDPESHVDDEIDTARWMTLDEAAAELTYKGDRDMVALARSRTNGGGQ